MRCWHCNAPVDIYIHGWGCSSPNCEQAGPPVPDALPITWREGMAFNLPYVRNFMLLYLTSFLRGFVTGATVFFIDLSLSLPLWARKNKTPIDRVWQQVGAGVGVAFTLASLIYILYYSLVY